MNLNAYADPAAIVREELEGARIVLRQDFNFPDHIIDSVKFVNEDDKHATYGCAALSGTKWQDVAGEPLLLLQLVAAARAWIEGLGSDKLLARTECERLIQRVWNIRDFELNAALARRNQAKKAGAARSPKIATRNSRWLEIAKDLVAAGDCKSHEAAQLIQRDPDWNPDGKSLRTVQAALKKLGFRS